MVRTLLAWLAFAAAVLSISLAGWWWVTAGDFHLITPFNFGNIYEAQLSSLEEGRADIPCNIATGEAFQRNGKCYVYFGIVPALLRMPILRLEPAWAGSLSRSMVWAAQLLFLIAVGLILIDAGHRPGTWTFTGYILLTAFGSTMQWMWGWPSTWVEAISWALAFAALSIYCLLKAATSGTGDGWLIGGCLLAMLAFFTRISTGAGPMLAVGLMAIVQWRRHGGRPRLAPAVVMLLLAASAFGYVVNNHVRMGTYLNAVPIDLHIAYGPKRLARLGGTLFHPEKTPAILIVYLLQFPVLRASYPWLEYRPGALFDFRGMDFVDAHMGVLYIMPALAWLAWAGWREQASRTKRWLLLTPLVGLLLLATIAAIAQRYVHEFILLLAPAGAYGLNWALATRRRRWITYCLSAWSIYAGWAAALVGQREIMYWVSDEALDRHRVTRYQVDRWLGNAPPNPIVFDYVKGAPPPPVTGVRTRIAQTGAEFEFDGSRWRQLSGASLHHYRVPARFTTLPDKPVRLFSAGDPPVTDIITLEPATAGKYRLRLEHWTTYWEFGPEFDLVAGREYVFDCHLDRLNREMRVLLDGKSIGYRRTPIWYWLEADVRTLERQTP